MSETGPNEPTIIHGVYRGGTIRLLEPAPWSDGSPVEIRLAEDFSPGDLTHLGKVIIAGFGLAGRWVADIFDRHKIEYVIIDQNPETTHRQEALGRQVVQGDVSSEETLRQAGVEQASILALTIPDEEAVLRATKLARRLNPHIYIVARTTYTSSGMEATQLGADAVVKAEQAVANRFYELLLNRIRTTAISDTNGHPTGPMR